uniref:Zinc finger BED domain-containing protein 5 n=1 Tax=Cacopsylla melanoneura TaxID=428564 RepID=A0A8D8VGS6_9HEMI
MVVRVPPVVREPISGGTRSHFQVFTKNTVLDKIQAFKRKLNLYVTQLDSNDLSSFPSLTTFLEENELANDDIHVLRFEIKDHLLQLGKNFDKYFPPGNTNDLEWIRNPFAENSDTGASEDQESFIDLTCDSNMKDLFYNSSTLVEFWMKIQNAYPSLHKRALKALLPFVTTYLCESGFSQMLYLKNKYRNKLNVSDDIRVKISNIQPDIESIVSDKK